MPVESFDPTRLLPTVSNHPTSEKGITHTTLSDTASITSGASSGVIAGSEQPTATGFGTVNDSSEGVAQTTPSSTGAEAPDPDSTDLTGTAQPTSNSIEDGGDVSDAVTTTSRAQPTSSSAVETDDAAPYNQKNVACKDYWSSKSPEKRNATDSDSTVQTFVDMFTADKLFLILLASTASGFELLQILNSGPPGRWRLLGLLSTANGTTLPVEWEQKNECPHAPERKDTDGAGAAALLEAILNIFISFQENYDAISRAGDLCDMQMQHFSDVFAPVPDSEGEIVSIIILTAMVGGLAGFLTGGAGALAGMAPDLGSSIGMEMYSASRPVPKDTSSSLGVIVGNVLEVYGNMTNELFYDGEYTHSSSDGLMANGGAMATDANPYSNFTGLKTNYQRLFFQQLALVTWQNLEVDGKNHVPLIAFDKGPCDKVDPKQESSIAHLINGIGKLDPNIDFQGDCYYLLDAYPDRLRPTMDHGAECWQNHSKQNGYASALSSGNLVKDPQAPGVVNIPVCDFVADFENPGVGCPKTNQYSPDSAKCELIPASQCHNRPGQWQKNEVANNANQLPDYQLSVDIYDQDGRRVGSATKQSAANPIEDPPASATIDHPLPATPIVAVAGLSSYINTYSKTAPPAATVTPDYKSGVCVMKITQYQRNDEKSNPTNDYQLEINVKDGDGKQAANLPKQPCPSGKPVVMHGLKGGDFNVIVGKNLEGGLGDLGDLSKISFNYNGQDFDTDSLECLHGPKGQYEDGDRELNYNINC
ncbi:MAG: hypothetical protein Q9188_005558 [Gyalolechia gomerana]